MTSKDFINQLVSTMSQNMADNLYETIDNSLITSETTDDYLKKGFIDIDLSENFSINAQQDVVNYLFKLGIPSEYSTQISKDAKELLRLRLLNEGWTPKFMTGDKLKLKLPFKYNIESEKDIQK